MKGQETSPLLPKLTVYSTGKSIQYSVTAYMGKESKEEKNLKKGVYTHTHTHTRTHSLCCTPDTHTTLSVSYPPIKFTLKKNICDELL